MNMRLSRSWGIRSRCSVHVCISAYIPITKNAAVSELTEVGLRENFLSGCLESLKNLRLNALLGIEVLLVLW